jgi:putative pyrroloquinoline-quinone binding quinoprotein/putative pyrroloquinoline-quinone-binding quinoprotein
MGTRVATAFVSASLLVASVSAGQSPATVQFLPLVPRWAVDLSAPPSGPPLIAGSTIVVSLQPGAIVGRSAADGAPAWRVEIATDRPISADTEHAYVASGTLIQALRLATGDVAWRAEAGTLTAPLLVHGGWVIAASGGNISAFRATDGSPVWQRNIGPIEHRPAIDGDVLFVPLADERLAGLDLQTGAVRWARRLEGTPGEPMALGGKVYVGASDKHFYAFDASRGEFDWKVRVGAATRGRAAADDDHVYFVAFDNLLRALDRGVGTLEWSKRLSFRPASGPIVIGAAVLVPGSIATLPVFGGNGAEIGKVQFPAALAAIPSVAAEGPAKAVMAVVTGDLEHPWMLSLLEPSSDPPAIALVVLTELPGETLVIVLPR